MLLPKLHPVLYLFVVCTSSVSVAKKVTTTAHQPLLNYGPENLIHSTLPREAESGQESFTVSAGLSLFNSDLYREVLQSFSTNENRVIAPYGINILLGMLYAGAGGDTAAEMRRVLKLMDFDDRAIFEGYRAVLKSLSTQNLVQLNVATKLFQRDGFPIKESYISRIQDTFSGETEVVDFNNAEAAAAKINEWVKERTYNKIQGLITPSAIVPLTELIGANAIYFNASWKSPFDSTETRRFFTDILNQEYVETPFMMNFNTFFEYGYIRELDAEAISLPYSGDRFAMIALLPNQTTGIADLERRISTGYDLTSLHSSLEYRRLSLYFPNFNIQSEINYLDGDDSILAKLGLTHLRTKEADFSLLTEEKGLKVTNLLQKTFIDVNERGTEASATSTELLSVRFTPIPGDKILKFNRPFLGYIIDLHTKSILFMYRKVK